MARGCCKGVEIELIDPVDQGRSWAYVFFFEEDPPPLSPLPDYIKYDFDTERLETEYWRAEYTVTDKGKHTNYYDEFVILPAGGGNGENFIDRLKVRSTIKLFFGKVIIKKDEKNFASRASNAWIHGPIRVVRRLEHKVKGPMGMNLVRISRRSVLPNQVFRPYPSVLPVQIERVVSSMHLLFGTDYAPIVKGSTYYNRAISRDSHRREDGRNGEGFNPAGGSMACHDRRMGKLHDPQRVDTEAEGYAWVSSRRHG